MAVSTRNKRDSLEQYYALEPIPNDILNDQRTFTDEDFFNGLNRKYAPLKPVFEAFDRGEILEAKARILAHFRMRTDPKIAKFHTDPHWSDWGKITVEKRADALCRLKYYLHDGGRLDFTGGSKEYGGINWKAALKQNHEFARQGSMATLAHAWSLTQSEKKKNRYVSTFERWIRGYLAASPFILDEAFHREEFSAFGGPTNKQQTTAYVIYNWTAVLDSEMFRTPGVLSDEFAFFFLKNLAFRAFNYMRLIGSKWRADNHHLMERGVALYFIGVQYPEFSRAAEAEDYARLTIIRHFDYNLLPDNVGSEHCTDYNYRCFVRYALPSSVAAANGRTLLGKQREKRLKGWLEYNAFLTVPDGRLVDTGDGRASTLYRIAEESGAMFGNSIVKGVLTRLKQAGGVNPHFADRWEKTIARLPEQNAVIYPYAGHIAMRDGWEPDSMFLHMAIKNKSLYNIHTHWNIFEFTFAANGSRLIGNPTSQTYGKPSGVMRGFYFSMDAHNTLVIDDDNLKSYRALANAWGLQPTRITSAKTCLNAGGAFDYASFSHEGYLPLIHRRDVMFIRGRYVIMTDVITMDFSSVNSVFALEGDIRPHTYRQRIHFEEGVLAKSDRTCQRVIATDRRARAGVLIVPEPFENLRADVKQNEYLQALNDPAYARYRMADIHRSTIGACMFSTVYRPFRDSAPDVTVTALTPKTSPYRDDRVHAIRIDDGEFTDIWFTRRDLNSRQSVCIDRDGVRLKTDAACLFVSLKNGKPVQTFRIGGRSATINGRRLATKSYPMTTHRL